MVGRLPDGHDGGEAGRSVSGRFSRVVVGAG